MIALEFADLSPHIGELSRSDDEWLAKVAQIDPRDYRIGIKNDHPADDEWPPLSSGGPMAGGGLAASSAR